MSTFKTLEDALEIVAQDIGKIKVLSESEKTLDKHEATKLTDYIKTLIAAHKDDREQQKTTNLLAKSDEELEDLAKQALEFLEAKEKDKEEAEKPDDKPDEAKDTEETEDVTTDTTQTDESKG